MAISSVELCSSALVKLGAQAISSFQDGTTEAEVASRLYTLVRDALLCVHPWSFATSQASLVRLSGEPVSDFAHAYALPQDLLKALSAGDASRPRGLRFQIIHRQLHTNADSVVLSYIFRPSEGDFPPYFSNAPSRGRVLLALDREFHASGAPGAAR
jgi:hypothetical protein